MDDWTFEIDEWLLSACNAAWQMQSTAMAYELDGNIEMMELYDGNRDEQLRRIGDHVASKVYSAYAKIESRENNV